MFIKNSIYQNHINNEAMTTIDKNMNTDYRDERIEMMITGWFQKALYEKRRGRSQRSLYLRTLQKITSEPQELGFFLDGDSLGYSPDIEVQDVKSGFFSSLAANHLSNAQPKKRMAICLLGFSMGALGVGAYLSFNARETFGETLYHQQNAQPETVAEKIVYSAQNSQKYELPQIFSLDDQPPSYALQDTTQGGISP